MKNVQRNQLFLVGVTATILGSTGCKKYPDGPAFSLKSKKARLVGEWEMTDSDINNDNAEVFFEFEEDGDFSARQTYTYGNIRHSYTYNGEWEFSSDKEELELEIDGDKAELEILRLTNKALFLEDEYGDEVEFEKQ